MARESRRCPPHVLEALRLGRERYWTPERRAAQAARLKAKHADPAFAVRHAANSRKVMLRHHADPEFAARHRERARQTMLRLRQDPAFMARRPRRGGDTVPR